MTTGISTRNGNLDVTIGSTPFTMKEKCRAWTERCRKKRVTMREVSKTKG